VRNFLARAADKRLMAQTTYSDSEFVPRVRRKRNKGRGRRRLKLLLFIFGACCAVALALVATLLIALKRSDAYAASFAYVARHGLVKQELGEPIEGGVFATGTLRIDPAGGESRLQFEVCGPQACADASVLAQGLGGQWRVVDAVLTLNGKTYEIGPE
jgi:hypothetical protein